MRCKNFIKILRKVLLTGKEGEEEEKKKSRTLQANLGTHKKEQQPFWWKYL